MGPPSRNALQAMKRTDLQRLCKGYGVKANLKTEAIIELLLEASQPPPEPHEEEQCSPPIPGASERVRSHSRGKSSGSTPAHEIDDEVGHSRRYQHDPDPIQPDREPVPIHETPATRRRKAKETQVRLGVGKPVIAGGSGARAVTKSESVPRSRRGKPKMVETIVEDCGITDQVPAAETQAVDDMAMAVDEGTETPKIPQLQLMRIHHGPLASLEEVDKYVAEAIRPLHEQLESLKDEFERLRIQAAEADKLRSTVLSLTNEVEGLKIKAASAEAEVEQLRQTLTFSAFTPSPRPMSPTRPRVVSAGAASSSSHTTVDHQFRSYAGPPMLLPLREASASPINAHGIQTSSDSPDTGTPRSMLGKRPRDSTATDMTGIGEEVPDIELEKVLLGHVRTKKRPKLVPQDVREREELRLAEVARVREERRRAEAAAADSLGVGEFTVYREQTPTTATSSNSSYIDPSSRTERLPDVYQAPPTGPTVTSTANASENQVQPSHSTFDFAFLPLSETPMYPLSMTALPFPQPPTSPTPIGHGARSFRFGIPVRPRSSAGGGFDLGSAADLEPPEGSRAEGRRVTSHDVATGLGLTAVRTAASDPVGPNAPPMVKKTMYGTELEGDLRFGDFGVQGVASGFWASSGKF